MLDNKPYKGANPTKISQLFGVNPRSYQPNGHTGLDMVASYGTWLVAPQDVIVIDIITNYNLDEDLAPLARGYGIIMCTIKKPFVYYLYWHCLPVFPVEIGDEVKKGQQVAQMGNSGFVKSGGKVVPLEGRSKPPYKGTHLHWAMKINDETVDPLKHIDWSIPIRYDLWGAIKAILINMLSFLKSKS